MYAIEITEKTLILNDIIYTITVKSKFVTFLGKLFIRYPCGALKRVIEKKQKITDLSVTSTLTSVCGRVLESIVRDKIVSHMMTNNLFCDEQHGFVPGRSCVTQLLCVMEMWTNSLNSREEIDCIYLDFQKAFDTVPYARLISKLKAYNGMEAFGGSSHKMDNKLSVKSHTKSCCQ